MEMFLNYLGTLPGVAIQGLVWGVMAVGLFITFKILDVADMTVDGSVCLGGAVCAVMVTNGVNIYVAMLCALIAGMCAGLMTGILHTFFGIPAILAGILTQISLWSVNLLIMKGSANISISRFKFGDKLLLQMSADRKFINIGILVIFSVVIITLLYTFLATRTGAALRATGNNRDMSRAQGINTNFTTVLGLVISNGIVALAGSLLAQYSNAADINMGKGAIVTGLAAITIGEALCSRFNTPYAIKQGCVIMGSIIYWLVYQTVIFLGLPSMYMKALAAVVVILFLGVPHIKRKYFAKKKKPHKVQEGGAVNA